MEHYRIREAALNWLNSFRISCKQIVSVKGHSSSLCDISCGVHQGSVLGPILFLIYINGLPNSPKFFFFFADDTNIYWESDDLRLLIRKLYKELKKMKMWFDLSKLAIRKFKEPSM